MIPRIIFEKRVIINKFINCRKGNDLAVKFRRQKNATVMTLSRWKGTGCRKEQEGTVGQ